MEMLGGFSDLLWTDQQGNGGQGMGVGCGIVVGAPQLSHEALIDSSGSPVSHFLMQFNR